MKTILKGGLATLTLAAGLTVAGAALAERYNSPSFAYGSQEAYLIQHCFYNPCNVDYTRYPNWPSNPINREPSVNVYEYPGYDTNEPPPPEDEQYPSDDNEY